MIIKNHHSPCFIQERQVMGVQEQRVYSRNCALCMMLDPYLLALPSLRISWHGFEAVSITLELNLVCKQIHLYKDCSREEI